VDRSVVLEKAKAIEAEHKSLEAAYPMRSLYLPFQYRQDGLRMMSNYFAKMPKGVVGLLFGTTGLADHLLGDVDSSDAPAQGQLPQAKPSFLQPFKPKADADYIVKIAPRSEKRTRKHETLVNGFVKWAVDQGLATKRNQAIDIAIGPKPLVIEAKIVPPVKFANVLREAVGQLYEYRYFSVVGPKSPLAILSSRSLDAKWVKYLEEDRGIGVIWPDAGGFALSRLAKKALTS
jgi:hypothetical protein